MHLFSLVSLLLCLWAPQAEEKPPLNRVMILKDGRIFSVSGDPQISGDTVFFTDYKGDLMNVPIERVDLEKMRVRNEELAILEKQNQLPTDDSLYANAVRYRREHGIPDPTGTQVITNEEIDSYAKKNPHRARTDRAQIGPENPTEAAIPEELRKVLTALEQMSKDQEEAETPEQFELQLRRHLAGEGIIIPEMGAWLFVMLGAMFLTSLISWGTVMYLIVAGFKNSAAWGIGLLSSVYGPFFLSLLSIFMAQSPGLMVALTIGSMILSLASLVLIPLFIVKECYGKRLLLFILWLSPFMAAIGCGIYMAILL